jgi:hypothetical protein
VALGRSLRETVELAIMAVNRGVCRVGWLCRGLVVRVVAAVGVLLAVFSVVNRRVGACFFLCSRPVACHACVLFGGCSCG